MASETSRNIAFASYILPVGWMVAIVSRHICSDHTDFTNFHLRQGLGLSILELLSHILVYKIFDLWIPMQILNVIFLLMTIYGIRSSFSGTQLYQPLIGRLYERIFWFVK